MPNYTLTYHNYGKLVSKKVKATSPKQAVKNFFKGKTEGELPQTLLNHWTIIIKNSKGEKLAFSVAKECKVSYYYKYTDITENMKKFWSNQ